RDAAPVALEARLHEHANVEIEVGDGGGDSGSQRRERGEKNGQQEHRGGAPQVAHGSILSTRALGGAFLRRWGTSAENGSSWNSARRASSIKVFQTCSRSSANRGDASVSRVRGRGRSTSTISETVLGRPLRTTTRSPISTASSIEWVTKTIEV